MDDGSIVCAWVYCGQVKKKMNPIKPRYWAHERIQRRHERAARIKRYAASALCFCLLILMVML